MMSRYRLLPLCFALLLSLILGACGGGGGGSSSPSPANSTVVAVAAGAAPVSNCPNGGITVDSGIDKNGNGILDLTEITSTQYVCNGASGVKGKSFLITTADEPAGGNCANGGKKINAGLDMSGDNILDPGEITSNAYVCNGTNGANGSNGWNSLSAVVPELPGGNCVAGGWKLTTGLDKNNNNVLEPGAPPAGEVTATSYVCHGSNGANGLNGYNSLTVAVDEPVGSLNCPAGGKKITSGLDISNFGILDPTEVTSTSYVCNGIQGSSGLNSLSITAPEPMGIHCQYGGMRLQVGLDKSRDGILDPNEITSTDYACNGAPGATGATGPAGPGITWFNVTGTAWQMASNTGYLANNAAQVTLTLPASAAIGDMVQVTGAGTGGWKIAQNAGQSIRTQNLPGANGALWNPHEAARAWDAVASSWDGTQLVAAVDAGLIYTSNNSGLTWTSHLTNQAWRAVASSSDGTKLVAAGLAGAIYHSADSGVTWTSSGPIMNWSAVASSLDGTRLVAAPTLGNIQVSTDAGATWSVSGSPNTNWSAVASSADGMNLVAAANGGQLYTSTDGGITWTPHETARVWTSIASSMDGTHLVATASQGQIYISADSGATWTAKESSRDWRSVTSSWDGTNLAAVAMSGIGNRVYISSDGGLTWVPRGTAQTWRAITSSWDGGKLLAAVNGGQLYTSITSAIASTTVGITGSIVGLQYDAITLQYLGNNTFTVLSFAGSLSVQ